MENMGRLKMLEYVNFTLNCIEIIENLEGCEVLHKLDMTANFIGDLRCIKSLKANKHLRLVYLTGNPCVQYEHYRKQVIQKSTL
jgi:protein TilB